MLVLMQQNDGAAPHEGAPRDPIGLLNRGNEDWKSPVT